MRGVLDARGVLGVLGVLVGVLGELLALRREGDPSTRQSVFSTHASASAAVLGLFGLLSLSSPQNLTGESNLVPLYAHSVSMSKLNRRMNRFLSRAYCSAIRRFVSSLSGAPNKHLQLPRRLLGVLGLRAMVEEISNLRCLGVRPPAAIVPRQVSSDWFTETSD